MAKSVLQPLILRCLLLEQNTGILIFQQWLAQTSNAPIEVDLESFGKVPPQIAHQFVHDTVDTTKYRTYTEYLIEKVGSGAAAIHKALFTRFVRDIPTCHPVGWCHHLRINNKHNVFFDVDALLRTLTLPWTWKSLPPTENTILLTPGRLYPTVFSIYLNTKLTCTRHQKQWQNPFLCGQKLCQVVTLWFMTLLTVVRWKWSTCGTIKPIWSIFYLPNI